MDKKQQIPSWWSKASGEEFPHPCVKIILKEEAQDHDGYCLDHKEFDIAENKIILYLPKGDWDFSMTTWHILSPDHDPCYCGAVVSYTILSIEELN